MAYRKLSKYIYSILFLVISIMFISACSSQTGIATELPPKSPPEPAKTDIDEPTVGTPATPSGQPITIEDGLGREVILLEPAQIIISLAPSNTEILFAVGAGDKVVGRDEFSDYPDQAMGVL